MSEERYEIRGKLGQGGLGAVYRAYDKNLNREVAIKRVLPDGDDDNQEEATKSLLKEAKALSAVQHPHIVTIYDCGVDEDGPFVVMEILEGRTIEEMVGQGTLVWEDFREVVMQTQEALIAAQDLDLVHRDLKPGNIMVVWLPSGKFQIKLVDFGLAKFSATPSLQTMDHGHAVFGSIYFMAPEQFERRPLDQRTDMYAMGAIYYYTLTGEYPFDGDTAPQVMAAHLQHKVKSLSESRPDIPDWAAEWVMWQIERDMDNRPTNAREALQRFLAIEKQHAGGGLPMGATGPQLAMPSTQTGIQNIPSAVTNKLNLGGVASSTTRQVTASTNQVASQAIGATNAGAPVVAPPFFTQNPKPNLLNNKPLLIGIASGLVGLIVIVGMVMLKGKSEATKWDKAVELINRINSSDSVTPTVEEVETLLQFYKEAPADMQWQSASAGLLRANNSEVDIMIIDLIKDSAVKIPQDRLTNLYRILGGRTSPASVRPILEYAKNGNNISISTELLKTIGEKTNETHIPDLIELLAKSTQSGMSAQIENLIKTTIQRTGKADRFVNDFKSGLISTTDPKKQAMYLRLLALTGVADALSVIKGELGSTDESRVRVAINALANWPNDTAFDLLLGQLPQMNKPRLKQDIFKSAIALLKQPRARQSSVLEGMWVKLARAATSREEKLEVINGLATNSQSWAHGILDFFVADSDKDVSLRAEKAKEYIDNKE